jgi:hypothetical protein
MGTNFYARKDGFDPLHIGKRSARSRFTFRGYPQGPKSWREWQAVLAEGWTISDNSTGADPDEVLTLEEFGQMVERMSDGRVQEPDFVDEEGHPFLCCEFS